MYSSEVLKNRKRKTQDPCLGCYLHKNLCICHELPKILTKTKLTLVIHHRELKRTTNTGRLAQHCLVNSEMIVRGLKDSDSSKPLLFLDPEYQALLLFPGEDSIELTSDFVSTIERPIQLIVPDGNWRQASKVKNRYGDLKKVQKVFIKHDLDQQVLRKEIKADGMATMQAIAFAFGKLENQTVQHQLLKVYEQKLVQTLKGRGIKPS